MSDPAKRQTITPAQIRAARGLLGWKQTDLASASDVSEASIKNIERGLASPKPRTLAALETSLRAAGVSFVDGGVKMSDVS